MSDEIQNDAAPSSTDPAALPNAAGGASPEGTSSPAVSAPDASPSVAAEAGNVGGSASTAEPATTSVAPSVSAADAGTASTLEQRLDALEGYLMKLPHSIAHAFSQGSAEPEELASRALAHLFGKN